MASTEALIGTSFSISCSSLHLNFCLIYIYIYICKYIYICLDIEFLVDSLIWFNIVNVISLPLVSIISHEKAVLKSEILLRRPRMWWVTFLFLFSRFFPCHIFWDFMMYPGVNLFKFFQYVGHWASQMCRLIFSPDFGNVNHLFPIFFSAFFLFVLFVCCLFVFILSVWNSHSVPIGELNFYRSLGFYFYFYFKKLFLQILHLTIFQVC